MAAAMLIILCVDTFATGLLLRHVLALQSVVAKQGEHVVSLADELSQVGEHVDSLADELSQVGGHAVLARKC